MSSFIISARKYRPQNFSQIQGQKHVTTTLKNALKTNQLAQVFLFCGPKGTGKTTCARVLAKAINCQKRTATAEPCDICVSCQNIQQHRSLNIHELDAASHNSVEDIRNLVDQVRYRPPSGKKIFIIDEAHMLSNAAFHGLLKTLEEPPRHVVFIFATTEKYKVIDTILSRCQIFDFHYLPTTQILHQLQYVADKEKVTYEQEALQLISHKAEGSLRDALSSFDLVINFEANKNLTYKATLRHLNLLDHDYYFKLTHLLTKGQVGEALSLYDTIMRTSFRGDHFITGFSEHLRNILTTQIADTLPLINPTIINQTTYQKQASKVSSLFLHHALQITHNYGLHYKNAQNKRLHVEIMLIQIAQITDRKAEHEIKKITQTKNTHAPPSKPPTPDTSHHKKKFTSHITNNIDDTPKPTIKPLTPNSSIKQATSTTPEVAPANNKEPSKSTKAITSLTKQIVLPHWKAYAQSIEATDPAGFNIMNLPIEVRENSITIMLVNPSQKDKVTRLKQKLSDYIAQKLNNKNFVITTTVQKKEAAPATYTQAEKFQHLIKKNPNIAVLQKKLDLEIL